jgi:hypothetical protein
MKERYGYKLPHPDFDGWNKDGTARYKDKYLPDYVTVSWRVNGDVRTVEVHPDRALDFIDRQSQLETIDDWWFE